MTDAAPEEEALLWQEVLDEIATGRVQDLRCPFCKGQISVDTTPERTRVACKGCRRFVEGRFE